MIERSIASSGRASWPVRASDPLIAAHRVMGRLLVPLAYPVALAVEAFRCEARDRVVALADFVAASPVVVSGDDVRLELDVARRARDAFVRFASGGVVRYTVRVVTGSAGAPAGDAAGCADDAALHPAEAVYARYAALGFDYGPPLRRILSVRCDGAVAHARIDATGLPDGAAGVAAVLDAALQSLIAHGMSADAPGGGAYLPIAFDRATVAVALPAAREYVAVSRLRTSSAGGGVVRFDLAVLAPGGARVARVDDLALKRL